MRIYQRIFLPAALALLAVPAPGIASPLSQDDAETVLAESAELLKRVAPRYHLWAYSALAGANDARAIEVLRKIYSKPGFPKKQTPFLIASALGRDGKVGDVLEELADWLTEACLLYTSDAADE